jgi:hypothetical protein
MAKLEVAKPGSKGDTSKPNFKRVDDKPTGAKTSDDGSSIAFPTSDLSGTDHPETAKPQEGVKGMEPASETGSKAESDPHIGQSGR